jgi:hypothetical protein
MPEYFIKYDKAVQLGISMQTEHKTIIVKARSGKEAWSKTTQSEKDFNDLQLVDMNRL